MAVGYVGRHVHCEYRGGRVRSEGRSCQTLGWQPGGTEAEIQGADELPNPDRSVKIQSRT